MAKLLLIDGSSLLHRAFFALPLLSNKDGVFTNAVHGFMMMFNRVLSEESPDYLAVCFDKSRHTFRNRLFADYKGTRSETPIELRGQFELIKQVLDASGVRWLEMDDFEADDLLGTLARRGAAEGFRVDIYTGDRDIFQLVDDNTTVFWTRKGISDIERVDEAAVRERYGVTPPHLADLKGLMGDSSDNIPGVAGVGEKTAVKLLSQYGDLETLYEHSDELKGKLAERIGSSRDMAFLSRDLATIRCDAPVKEGWDELAFDPDIDKSELSSLYAKLGLHQLMRRLKPTGATGESKKAQPAAPIDDPDRPWPEEGETDAATAPVEAAPAPAGDACVLLLQDGKLTLMPPGSGPLAAGDPTAYADLLADGSIPKITCDAKEIIKHLAAFGLSLSGVTDDVLLAAYLIDPSRGEYLLSELLPEYGLPAADPVRFLPALCQKLRDTLVSRDMMKLYTEMELPLSEVLARMELAGIRADAGRLREMSVELAEAADKYQKRIYEQAGHEFNINSPKQLGTVLFEELGIPPLKKTRSGYSTDAEVLETLALTQPICQDILDYRFVTKLRSTYTEGLSRLVAADGKIHTCFKQTVTATGRLSSVEPNLQNIPIRQEEGRRIRRVFMPDETGDYLLAADYSQIELRVLAHISGDAKLRQAYIDEEDIHARTASEVFGVPIDQVTPDLRRAAKAVNFGIVYGISSYGLSRDLGVSRNEAQQYIDRYLARYPEVAAYQARIILEAKEKGYVETLFGRRRYLPDLLSRNFNLRSFAQRVAMNAPIQGSAADIIKLAMISVDRDMRERGLASKMLLQVHDELIFNVPEGELEIMKEMVRQHMEHAVELSVPLTVDVKAGHDWYAMEEI